MTDPFHKLTVRMSQCRDCRQRTTLWLDGKGEHFELLSGDMALGKALCVFRRFDNYFFCTLCMPVAAIKKFKGLQLQSVTQSNTCR